MLTTMELTGEPVTDLPSLVALVGEPRAKNPANYRDRLTDHHRRFLALSPFLCLATIDVDGCAEISARGDGPGYVRVLDDRTLVIPERPGNRRAESMRNLLDNPPVALIAFVPGMDETLRIRGRGTVVANPGISAGNGRAARLGIVVGVEEVYFHCGKVIRHSRLWSDDYKIDRSEFPPLSQLFD